jgi:hypothetical protein
LNHLTYLGISMSQCIAQYVFKPNPGVYMSKVMAQVKVAAGIWKRHGAGVSFWIVSAGEIGKLVLPVALRDLQPMGRATTPSLLTGLFSRGVPSQLHPAGHLGSEAIWHAPLRWISGNTVPNRR